MDLAVALTNLVLGVAYTSYGIITLADMRRGWATNGFSHFGAAWVAMAFTCGPHHLFHGIHVAFEGRSGGALDLFAVAIGLPAGVMWLLLRIEAFVGGRGDRFISGTPVWLNVLPVVGFGYVTVLLVGGLRLGTEPGNQISPVASFLPNLLLVGIYCAIGYFLFRAQLRNRPSIGGWSVSGLSLSVVFPTCALMHGVWGFYTMIGAYAFDIHGFTIDWLSVPAAIYFLWVVRSLYRGSLADWNNPGREHRLRVAEVAS